MEGCSERHAAAPLPASAGEASVTALLYVSVVFLYGFIAFALMPLWWPVIRLCLLPLFRRPAREVQAVAIIFYLVGAAIVAGCVYVALVIKPPTGVLFVPPIFIAWGAQLLAFFNDPFMVGKK